MSKLKKQKSIYTSRSSFTDRNKQAIENFTELNIKIEVLDTALLLVSCNEDSVLINLFKHLTDFLRKQDENITVFKEKNVLDLLLNRKFFIENANTLVKRFTLYIATIIMESTNILLELETEKVNSILRLSIEFYVCENDNYCLEYLSIIINKCLDDPQAALVAVEYRDYLDKFFDLITRTENPDLLLHSYEAIRKMMQVLSTASLQLFANDPLFPIDRILCDLTNEFPEIRSAALKDVKILILDTSETSPFAKGLRLLYVLQQLTETFCDKSMSENASEIIEVLATAMRTEKITQLFFENNLFDLIVQDVDSNADEYMLDVKCKIISIFAECAKYTSYLNRLHEANVTNLFIDCLLHNEPAPSTHVVMGLNRLMKFPPAANLIVYSFDLGVITKLCSIMVDKEISIRTREQAAELVVNLLVYAFHKTASELLSLKFPQSIGEIFSLGLANLSIDYVLLLLTIIENLAQNNEYRTAVAESKSLIRHMANLLKNSFSAAIVVNNIFRCLCTLIEEEEVRKRLLSYNLTASMKRGLKSLANLVKTSVTNFIMQTTRFMEFVTTYIDDGVLEVLILQQKHSFCVPTWGPAIEAILSKVPTLKFCIRNHLTFTDVISFGDFFVSKKKFEDFRDFQFILSEEVSPLDPVLVVNFNKPKNPSDLVVHVPVSCFSNQDLNATWSYCRRPGDDRLPHYLETLNKELEEQNLVENPPKMQRCIDFDNLAKRAKIIAKLVAEVLGNDLKVLDLNSTEDCAREKVLCHLKELGSQTHCNFIPLGLVRMGCQFERATLFKALADQIGLPCTLQRSVDGKILFNEVPLPVEIDHDVHCDKKTMKLMPWRMLRPTHVVDLMYNVGELYPLQSRQALQYLRIY